MAALQKQTDVTSDYYSRCAREYVDRTNLIDMSDVYADFEPLLPAASVILDLGCGGGRDARHFARRGHYVIAMDPCPGILDEARRRTPTALDGSLQYLAGAAPGLPLAASSCSAIWACASLLHLPRLEMAPALCECSRILVPGGVAMISVKRGTDEGLEGERWFTYWEMAALERIASDAGFEILASSESSSLDQKEITWLRLLVRKPSTSSDSAFLVQ